MLLAQILGYASLIPAILDIIKAIQAMEDTLQKRKTAEQNRIKALEAKQQTSVEDKLIDAAEGTIKTQSRIVGNVVLDGLRSYAKAKPKGLVAKFLKNASDIKLQLLHEKVAEAALSGGDAVSIVVDVVADMNNETPSVA